MSWSRFIVVGLITGTIMIGFGIVIGPLVSGLDEPILTALILGVVLAIFYAVDVLASWLLQRLERSRG
ncbi:MAG: hypothetical protein H0W24_07705 [Lysobacter sp.]|nr:hypothetical protein [Lysobacter sp.]